MQVVKGLDHAGRVEPGGAVVKVAPVPENRPQLSAQAALHQHVQVLAVLERLVQLHDKVRVGLQEGHKRRGQSDPDADPYPLWWGFTFKAAKERGAPWAVNGSLGGDSQ